MTIILASAFLNVLVRSVLMSHYRGIVVHSYNVWFGWYEGSFYLLKKFFLAAWGLHCCMQAFWLSLVAASRGYPSGGYSLLWCAGFSLRWLLLLRSTGLGAWAQ